jgi:hypothetical protein
MAEHDRIVDGPAVISGPLMQVAAANADRADLQEHVLRTDLWPREVAELDGVALALKIDDGWVIHG